VKKSFILIIIFCVSGILNVSGQSRIYKPFKVDVGMSTFITTDVGTGNGTGFYFHPIYNLTDRFSFGPRMEFGYVLQDDPNFISAALNNGVMSMFSFQAVSDYYLSTERARFFLGLGFGLYWQALFFQNYSSPQFDANQLSHLSLGLNPRIGFNVGHFKMAANYNMTGDILYNYLNFTLGLEIGGGRYRK
jgi:hypothetical protein